MIDIKTKNNDSEFVYSDNRSQSKTHEKKVEVVKVTFMGQFKLTDYIHSKMLQELNN